MTIIDNDCGKVQVNQQQLIKFKTAERYARGQKIIGGKY